MSKICKFIMILLSVIVITGCVSEPKVEIKEKVYTQVGMWYLNKSVTIIDTSNVLSDDDTITIDKKIPSVNYSRDVFIPVNTAVTIIDNHNIGIIFEHEEKSIVLFNKKAYTGLNQDNLLKRMFSPTPVDLSSFTDVEQILIKQGAVELNMSKEALILSRGYPPIHRTPSLKGNTWRYWEARFNSRNYIFKDNKLIKLQN
ncbi:MAG: hypothetical protein ACI9RG_000609 [Sulfurimonas sp.]|jgi:hypothetical protein